MVGAALAALFFIPFAASRSAEVIDAPDSFFHIHGDYEEILVTAPGGQSRFLTLQSSGMLSGPALEEDLASNLGDTLDRLPGLASASFGPGVGQPVIRGLSGERVRVLVDGIGALDISNGNPDHAVAVDPFLVDSIEVLRGPAVLLYGGGAAGGVVNVLDGRIPSVLPETLLSGKARLLYGTNADEVSFAGAFDLKLGEKWVFHAAGAVRDAGEIHVPGFLRTEEFMDEHPLEDDEEEPRKIADNTSVQSHDASAGVSRFFNGGFAGIAVTQVNVNYGIPEVPGFGEEKEIRIDLQQTRFDFKAAIARPFLVFEAARLRFGYADYHHVEFENEATGTVFDQNAFETRLELDQRASEHVTGTVGLHVIHKFFTAVGDEAPIDPFHATDFGVFAFENYTAGPWTIQGDARVEVSSLKIPLTMVSRSFTAASLSGGVSYTTEGGVRLGLTAHRTERAPSAEELYSDGAEVASQTFRVGNPDLTKETGTGFEASLRTRAGRLTGGASVFVTRYHNFIFEEFTGEEEPGGGAGGEDEGELRELEFAQTNALFYGAEVEGALNVLERAGIKVNLDGVLDFVHAAERPSAVPLPRIPPLNVLIGGEILSEFVDFRIEGDFAADQTRVGMHEDATGGYASLNLMVAVRPFGKRHPVTFRIIGRNLTNSEIRYHTSFLKEVLPQPGRDVRLSIEGCF
jgi:iron complex outermembrane recepter protein